MNERKRILEIAGIVSEEVELDGRNEEQVKKSAISLSKKNRGMYIVPYVDFGQAFANMNKRLNVFSPSDATFGWYVINGKVKKFTGKQKVADQNNTPTMN